MQILVNSPIYLNDPCQVHNAYSIVRSKVMADLDKTITHWAYLNAHK